MFVLKDLHSVLVEKTPGVAMDSIGTQASSWAIWDKTLDLVEIQLPLP